jgi:hypothetical protein
VKYGGVEHDAAFMACRKCDPEVDTDKYLLLTDFEAYAIFMGHLQKHF